MHVHGGRFNVSEGSLNFGFLNYGMFTYRKKLIHCIFFEGIFVFQNTKKPIKLMHL